jgi:hypothetical protein
MSTFRAPSGFVIASGVGLGASVGEAVWFGTEGVAGTNDELGIVAGALVD